MSWNIWWLFWELILFSYTYTIYSTGYDTDEASEDVDNLFTDITDDKVVTAAAVAL